jgi:hypothetical protein
MDCRVKPGNDDLGAFTAAASNRRASAGIWRTPELGLTLILRELTPED